MTETDFEKHWRSRVRRQYGALALRPTSPSLGVSAPAAGSALVATAKAPGPRLERMREADAAQEARERESALAALLGEVVPDPGDDDRIKGS
jgi:hypothetical protein